MLVTDVVGKGRSKKLKVGKFEMKLKITSDVGKNY